MNINLTWARARSSKRLGRTRSSRFKRLPQISPAAYIALSVAVSACNATDLSVGSDLTGMDAEVQADAGTRLQSPGKIFGAMGDPLPGTRGERLKSFERGRAVMDRRFTAAEGLGPEFNVSFCGACHEKPVPGGSAGRYRNFLLTGAQLPDGSFIPTGKSGVGLHYSLDPEVQRVPDDEDTNTSATRNPIPFFGAGLLAELDDQVLLANADPDDEDEDGISGRPNYDDGFVGRFGRKSQTVSIEGFIRGPLFNHLGITSNPLSDERRDLLPVPSGTGESARSRSSQFGQLGEAQAAAPGRPTEDNDQAPDPELSPDDLFDLVSFAMLLAAPIPDVPTEATEYGRELFDEVGCVGCHIASLEGPHGTLPLYSDLLLHDMGDELADGIRMLAASGHEFRTQPLWGISAVGPYLHDGRADTLAEAISLHGGEAEASKSQYAALSDSEQEAVLEFLTSLGGRSQATPGLLPPGAPLQDPGELGGSLAALSATQEREFLAGRAVFDRDMTLVGGLGPAFNGDSCRACHFEPLIGGAGPIGVNVMRQGLLVDQQFAEPEGGTMAHHFLGQPGERPSVDKNAMILEQRQTPTLFGLGLVDRIPDETFERLADPEDADGNGVSGRIHVLADGRIGRLGWKAQVPSLAEFARDAMSVELGITLPAVSGHTFGMTKDSDSTLDPELSKGELQQLVFFMQQLAPPPQRVLNEAGELGRELFTQVGCQTCHTPTLHTDSGEAFHAYSDFLLHDVAAPDYVGIGDGAAGSREFRTAPLWGISQTAPYMHDGFSDSLEEAVVRHAAEASSSVDAYVELSNSERAALITFLESL